MVSRVASGDTGHSPHSSGGWTRTPEHVSPLPSALPWPPVPWINPQLQALADGPTRPLLPR